MERKATVRRPEDIRFRNIEENTAAEQQQVNKRKSSQCNKSKVNIDSFDFLGLIGSGGYGNVYMAKKKSTGKLYAIKRLCKRKLMQEGK